MPFVSFKNSPIHYTETGSGRAVVLLHGFLENSTMWNAMLPVLAKAKRVISIDLPGHGQSECLGYVHTMELMAEAVETVLKHLNIRKAVFVGHSMGGYVSLALAEKNPELFKGLCLFFSTAHADSAVRKQGRDQAVSLVKDNHKSFIRKAIPLLFRPKNRALFRPQINALKKEALTTSKQGVIAALEGMKQRTDREVVLQFCPYPVHFIIGRYDPVLSHEALIQQANHSERATYTLLKECGHMGFIEAEETCTKELKQFVNRCYS